MKSWKMERQEVMLLALLRAALHQQEVETLHLEQATEDDWEQCFRLAVRQGVSALAWEGVERLPVELSPPLNVKLSWALVEKKQVAKYRKHCQALDELIGMLARHGIATLVLKGVGLSRLYPVPAHREGGDIDIYTYSADKSCMTDEEANNLANELLVRHGAIMEESAFHKHSKCCYKGITLENHRMFLHEAECQMIVKAELWLEKHMETQEVELLDGEYRIVVPCAPFDRVFVSLHAAQHYGMGLSLKHLCDWVLLVKQHGMNLPLELDDLYFNRVMNTFTQLCDKHLGMELPIKAEEKMVDEMMSEILYPPYFQKIQSDSSLKSYWLRLKNRIHIFRLKRRLLGVSFWGKMRGLCVRTLKRVLYNGKRL